MKKYRNISEAIEANDIKAVKKFLPKQLEDRDWDWFSNRTPLYKACMLGHIEIVRLLLDSGADINARDSDGGTPLHLACYWGNTEIVRLLLDRGADINARDKKGNTPLHSTCLHNCHIETARLLLDRGADIEAKNIGGWTPLHWACSSYEGKISMSEFLVSHGADPLVLSNQGKSAFDCDDAFVEDELGYKTPHNQILLQLRAEYINKHTLEASEHTAALSSGWEMEM